MGDLGEELGDLFRGLAADIGEFFTGDLKENDIRVSIQTKKGERKVVMVLPDEVVLVLIDCLRTGRFDTFVRNLLFRMYDYDAGDEILMESFNTKTGEVAHDQKLGSMVSRFLFREVEKALRASGEGNEV